MKTQHYIVGIDEVGRGPLAGPVAVGAVAATPAMLRKFRDIKESKQLSAEKREAWVKRIRAAQKASVNGELNVAVRMVSAKEIDRIGIAPAIRKALARALTSLALDPRQVTVLLDGGLKAPPEYKKQKTIIRGDASETAIAMASVVAKVRRDKLMVRLANTYPKYDFATHKGYGTAQHIALIRKHSLSEIHRKSFCRSFIKD